MKTYILVTLVAAALCLQGAQTAALYAEDGNVSISTIDFGTALKMYYTAFQKIMPCGFPPLKIPVLAPFSMDYYSFNLTNGYYKISGNVSNLVVTGLNNFRVLGGNFNTTTNRTSFDLIFPEVQGLGEYEMDAMAYLAGFPAQMAGKGLLNVKIVDFRMVGEFALTPSLENPNSLSVSDFNLHFYVGNVINNNWNTLWDISFNNFVNKFGSELTLMWAQQIQVQVDEIYAQLLLPNINGMLNDVSMSKLIEFFVSQSMEFDMANCTLD
ncbi:uncharacterized protein LOC119607934 [Lucilia sericata]|uniref:uncharacterized protein LOC119607934 n=1 Tax=Lucilia sericata TaxID=13632 RepID=UPI0018A818FA|nr:uncharacterized protein LOC119607934 [Lucilia sericata]